MTRTMTVSPMIDSAQPQPLASGMPIMLKRVCQAVMIHASPHMMGVSRLVKKSYKVIPSHVVGPESHLLVRVPGFESCKPGAPLAQCWCTPVVEDFAVLSGTSSTPPGFHG